MIRNILFVVLVVSVVCSFLAESRGKILFDRGFMYWSMGNGGLAIAVMLMEGIGI